MRKSVALRACRKGNRCPSLPFDDRCAEEAAFVRFDLGRSGPIGPNDLLIAATARAHDLSLVTHNTRELGRGPGLRVEDREA